MQRHDKPTNDVPLSTSEIAGFMNWRGPGAYTIHAEHRLIDLIAAAVKREREACAKVCDPAPGIRYSPNTLSAITGRAAAIRARGGE